LAQSYAPAGITLFVIEDRTDNTSVNYDEDITMAFIEGESEG